MVADHDGIALQTSTRAAHPRANRATSPPLVP
jgi:hypothetical protein